MTHASGSTVLPLAAPDLGLSGTQFIVVYLVLLACCTVFVALMRHRVFAAAVWHAPDPQPKDYRALSPSELAYLAGGPRRAMLTAVGTLLDRGIVDSSLRPLRPPHASDGLDRLQWDVCATIHRTASTGSNGGDFFDSIRKDSTEAFDALREELQRKGLAYTNDTYKAARRWLWLLYACQFLLLFRFATGFLNSRPTTWLFGLLILTALIIMWLRRAGTRKRQAGRLLQKARQDMAHLAPEYRPGYASYGPYAYPAAVALFGIAVLEITQPALAAHATVTAMGVHGTSGGADSYSSTCSGSDSSCSSDSGGGDGGGSCGGCGGGGD